MKKLAEMVMFVAKLFWRREKSPQVVRVAQSNPKKDIFDAQMDAQFGPEGGEGEQWPHSGL